MTEQPDHYCLRSQLSWRLVTLQAGLLAALVVVLIGALCASGVLVVPRDEDHVIAIVQRALARDAQGSLLLRPTAELKELRESTPDLWFLVRDRQGHSLSEGAVPSEFARIGDALDQISQARLGWQMFEDDPRKPPARLKRVNSDAGPVQVLTATQGPMTGARTVLATALAFLVITGLLLMAAATFVATPIVVRRAFAGLDTTADQARQIDFRQRGSRLSADHLPLEVAPLVTAINDALKRLDDGYSRHQRFVADAAHELRTPIAILNTRLGRSPRVPRRRGSSRMRRVWPRWPSSCSTSSASTSAAIRLYTSISSRSRATSQRTSRRSQSRPATSCRSRPTATASRRSATAPRWSVR